ncbi:MAG: 30S ribosome-binding factor RbfA [Bryobacterales bacterium]|nr:30S ribosome-binding factor RbfA [Bryobacteraceae bacterium]MDW8354037.1 30S ribosome-binding factor RbfA [Bryobacterales bacterium]
MDPHRTERISEALRAELDELIGYEMSDPRVEAVSVVEVIVTSDLRRARVRVAVAGGAPEQRAALIALEGARGYLRRALAARLRLFRIPELHFEAGRYPGPPELLPKVAPGSAAESSPE